MERISIGTTSHLEALRTRLMQVFADEGGMEGRLRETVGPGGLHVLCVELSDADPAYPPVFVRTLVASTLAHVVIDALEPELLARILLRHYGAFGESERRRILSDARRHLDQGPRHREVYRKARTDRVRTAVEAYLAESSAIHLEGLVTFRLPEYMADLEEATGQAVDDYLVEREYREFIRLLRYFVSTQPAKTGEVHLWVEGPRFELFSADGRRLEAAPQGIVELETVEAEVSLEDLLISTLIEASPTRIVLHAGGRQSSHAETVRRVFGGRVEPCERHGCLYCEGLGALTDRHQAP